jgi:hypothetical protein
MIVNAGVAAELAKGHVTVFDVVTLRISRGRIIRFPASTGTGGVATPIVDAVRWTDAPVPLRVYDIDVETTGLPPNLYQPLSGAAYKRDRLRQSVGREVMQLGVSVTGDLPINLSTACDSAGVLSGSFATSLMELCLLGLLDGARITVDQVVLPSGQLPSTPTAAGEAYGIVSTIPVRRFDGIVRKASPDNERITMECCDPLILGGGSVPVGIFSPLCRWELGEGQCPVAWNLGDASMGTHIRIPGTSVAFPDAMRVKLLLSDIFTGAVDILSARELAWAMLVPLDGPMMGMKFQIGGLDGTGMEGDTTHIQWQLADTFPWVWSCNYFHIEVACSKRIHASGADAQPRSCLVWDEAPSRSGLPSSLHRFSGCPDMPQPETA